MASRFVVAFVAIQGIVFQTANAQCVNRVLPSCGQNLLDTMLPNQVFFREPGFPSPCTGPVLPAPIYQTPIVSDLGYAPTVIQDSSVANSLANALQLLVVSNLLSTTLPGPCDNPACPYEILGMPAYNNYIY